MKIIQLTPYAMSRPGGVQTHIRDLSIWLRDQGHEVRVLAPPDTTGIAPFEQDVTPLGTARPWSVHGTRFEVSHVGSTQRNSCVAAMRDWGAEVVHLHTPWTPLMPWQMWRALDLPTVATFHATLPEGTGFDPIAWALRRVGHYFNSRIGAAVVPSQAPLDQWQAAGATPLPVVLPPTLDLSAWRDAAQTAQKSDTFRAIYMGRLEPRKGVSVLLHAWGNVRKSHPNATLVIAGAGPEEAALRQLAQQDSIGGVTFAPPPNDTEARRLIAEADVFVAPALHGESFGMVLIEAMAAGTVPVAAANEGFVTVMTGAGHDLLVPPGDVAALATCLLKLAQTPAWRHTMRKWGLAHAQSFDVKTVGPAYEALFSKTISSHSKR